MERRRLRALCAMGHGRHNICAVGCVIYHVTRIFRWLVWLSRIHRCQGFGVQSPSDFRFVREVINCHTHHPDYTLLDGEMPETKGIERKLCRLYYRLADSRKPETVVNFGENEHAPSTVYMAKGCSQSRINSSFESKEVADLMRIRLCGDCEQAYEEAIEHAGQQSVLVLEGIKRGRKERRLWRKAEKDERTGVTFDLYYAGIVFFDKKRYKENYTINF